MTVEEILLEVEAKKDLINAIEGLLSLLHKDYTPSELYVYVVYFINLYSEDFEFIGVYSTEEKAVEAKKKWIDVIWKPKKAPKWYQEAVEIIKERVL